MLQKEHTNGINPIEKIVTFRGLLDYKKPVTHYWPEFGVNCKESITVETLLSHQVNDFNYIYIDCKKQTDPGEGG